MSESSIDPKSFRGCTLYLRPFDKEHLFRTVVNEGHNIDVMGELAGLSRRDMEEKLREMRAVADESIKEVSVIEFLNDFMKGMDEAVTSELNAIEGHERVFLSGLKSNLEENEEGNTYVKPALIESTNDEWKALIKEMMKEANWIFIVPSHNEGTSWEIKQLLSDDSLLAKTFFVHPPKLYGEKCDAYHNWQEMTRKDLFEDHGLFLPPRDEQGVIFRVVKDENPTIEKLKEDKKFDKHWGPMSYFLSPMMGFESALKGLYKKSESRHTITYEQFKENMLQDRKINAHYREVLAESTPEKLHPDEIENYLKSKYRYESLMSLMDISQMEALELAIILSESWSEEKHAYFVEEKEALVISIKNDFKSRAGSLALGKGGAGLTPKWLSGCMTKLIWLLVATAVIYMIAN